MAFWLWENLWTVACIHFYARQSACVFLWFILKILVVFNHFSGFSSVSEHKS